MDHCADKARELADFSREFGTGSDYVIAGGGNSSLKFDGIMLVKTSGSRMGTIEPEHFVAMDMSALRKLGEKEYPPDPETRERMVLADLLAARKPGEEAKRPSVEALLHALFPQAYVMHTHPAIVNGLTCAVDGRGAARRLFGDEVLWIPNIEPGFVLAKAVGGALAAAGREIRVILLENHGVFVAGDSRDEIRRTYDALLCALEAEIRIFPNEEPVSEPGSEYRAVLERIFTDLSGADAGVSVEGFSNAMLLPFLEDEAAFAPLQLSLTPDHIVYAGFRPVYARSRSELAPAVNAFFHEHGVLPKIAAVQGVGCFACASGPRAARDARDVFLDAVRVVIFSRAFGGPKAMPEYLVDFIRNWEVEKYRASR